MINAETLERLEELEKKAFKGPWFVEDNDYQGVFHICANVADERGLIATTESESEAEFISAIREHAADLIQAAKELARVRTWLKKHEHVLKAAGVEME